MRTFRETFKDNIDASDGTVVLNEEKFEAIQREAYAAAMVDASRMLDKVPMQPLTKALLTAHFYVRTVKQLPEAVQKQITG